MDTRFLVLHFDVIQEFVVVVSINVARRKQRIMTQEKSINGKKRVPKGADQ